MPFVIVERKNVMDSDKPKNSYLPRSWGSGREEKKTDNIPIPDEEVDAQENIKLRSEPPTRVLESSDLVTIDNRNNISEDDSDREIDEYEPIKAQILETPIKTSPVRQVSVSDIDSASNFSSDTEADTELTQISPEPDISPDPSAQSYRTEDKRSRRIKINIVGVRFGYACKIYRFDAGDLELKSDDWVIVKTEKGLGLGRVALPPSVHEIDSSQLDGLRKVIRKAGKVDFDQKGRLAQKEREAYNFCLERIEELQLPMKLVGVDCFFDGSKYVFFFTAEGRVDFRELVRQLVVRFPVRIEMRQIGVRHEAKMTGGVACCGQELCCSRFLTDFRPVSVKMAKAQNLSLNPTKISGICGRLMCCLGYEHEIYEQFRKGLPKVGRTVITTSGQGIVSKYNPLSETVSVRLENESQIDVKREEILEVVGSTARNSANDVDEPELENFCEVDMEGDSLEFSDDICKE